MELVFASYFVSNILIGSKCKTKYRIRSSKKFKFFSHIPHLLEETNDNRLVAKQKTGRKADGHPCWFFLRQCRYSIILFERNKILKQHWANAMDCWIIAVSDIRICNQIWIRQVSCLNCFEPFIPSDFCFVFVCFFFLEILFKKCVPRERRENKRTKRLLVE